MSISLLNGQVDSNKKLGEWVGLCKFDKEGKARKASFVESSKDLYFNY